MLAGIEDELSIAGFPRGPTQPVPPGASLVTMSRYSESVSMDQRGSRGVAGYGDIIQRCHAWLCWLRAPSASEAPPAGLWPGG